MAGSTIKRRFPKVTTDFAQSQHFMAKKAIFCSKCGVLGPYRPTQKAHTNQNFSRPRIFRHMRPWFKGYLCIRKAPSKFQGNLPKGSGNISVEVGFKHPNVHQDRVCPAMWNSVLHRQTSARALQRRLTAIPRGDDLDDA